jgi:hypothetical protein
LVDFLHRCSKLIRISYAAGPSILQCKSCHGCLGALVPDYHKKQTKKTGNDKINQFMYNFYWKNGEAYW